MKRITALLAFLFLLGMQVVNAQNRDISGTVTSAADGSPIPGANVVVKGTTNGTVTDFDGKYKLSLPSGQQTLVFSFIGMQSKEVITASSTTIDISLEAESTMLSDVVVTALGIKKSKKALGYSLYEAKTEDMEKVAVTDATEGLRGKIAGVSISSSSGAPGASTSIIIRGISSLTQSNQPLYVLDGVPINNPFAGNTTSSTSVDFGNAASDINPGDIESMSILKGTAATSQYGSRGANGVVLITTKSGKKGAPLKVSLSSSTSVETVGRLPYYQKEFGQGWSGHFDSRENGSWGPALDGVERLTGYIVNGSQRLKPFAFQENGLRDFFEYGYTAQNSIALSGSTDALSYYASYANTYQDGVIPGDKDRLNRNTFTFKANGGTAKTKIDFGATYTQKFVSAISTGQGDDASNGKTLFQEILQNPVDMYIPMFRDYNSSFDNLDNYYTPYAQNPYFIINENGNELRSNRVNTFLNISHTFMEGLTLSWRGGVDNTSNFIDRWGAIANISKESPNSSANNVVGAVDNQETSLTQMNSDIILTYELPLKISSKESSLRFTIGNNLNQIQWRDNETLSKGLIVPNYYNVANISGSAEVSSDQYTKRTSGVYGSIDFDYGGFFFAQFTARNDWSSTLPKDKNSFFYPGINTGFVFSELLPANNFMPYGKLRASYAYAGNDAPVHSLNAVYRDASIAADYGLTKYPVGGVAAFEKNYLLGNPKLSPEISTEFEVGLDLRFFSNRLGMDLSYYQKVTSDIIMEATIAASSGYTTQTTNLGQITNSGIELMLTGSPIKTSDFDWNMSYVFTKSNTILDKLDASLGVNEYVVYSAYQTEFVAIPGRQLGMFRIPDYLRSDKGEIVVGDNGLPLEGPKALYASSVPDYKMSLTNTLKYKDLSLSFLLDYQQGGYMYSYTSSITFWSGNNEQSTANERRPYVIPNSVVLGPKVGEVQTYEENTTPIDNNWHEYYSSNTNRPIESTRIIEKTYVKLRELSISYTIPSSLTRKIKMSSANVSLYGRNLFLWTPAGNSFVDPETSTYGNDLRSLFGEFGGAPSTRTYGVKLNVTF